MESDDEKLQRIINEIKIQMEKPNYKPETSEQIRIRSDNQVSMIAQILRNGGGIKPEWQ